MNAPKTDDTAKVGKHLFEVANLGRAPFLFVGMKENRFQCGDGSSKPGGVCDYCGTALLWECWVQSADGKEFKVGSDCILKVGDLGLYQSYKTNPEVRERDKAKRKAKDQANTLELARLVESKALDLAARPHPDGFTDRATGRPLTMLDWATWMAKNCGATGRGRVLRRLQRELELKSP